MTLEQPMTPEQTAEFLRIYAHRRRSAPHESALQAKARLLAFLGQREWKTVPVNHWCSGGAATCWACIRPEDAERFRASMDQE